MGRVLIATAGTEYDQRAIEKALELLNPNHHFIFLTVTGLGGIFFWLPPQLPCCHRSCCRTLRYSRRSISGPRRRESAASRRSVDRLQMTAAIQVESGDPADRICAAADEQNVDLIVIGSSDASLVQRILRGSISDQVAHRAPCPVLLMHLTQADVAHDQVDEGEQAVPS